MSTLASLLSATWKRRRLSAAALLLAGQLGCVGNLGDLIDGPGSSGDPSGADPNNPYDPGDPYNPADPNNPNNPNNPADPNNPNNPTPTGELPGELPEVSLCDTPGAPGPRVLRRLTSEQFESTVRDLFGDPTLRVADIFDDPVVLGFSNDADALVVRDLTSQQLMNYAEEVATWAVTNRLSSLSSCRTNDASCRQAFIRSFGRRAFRAPLSDARVAAYDKIFQGESSFEKGAEAVIAAMLQSPYFVYRRELGAADPGGSGLYTLDQHEIASGISYLITGSMPDETLLAAADAGQLSTPDQIEAQAKRLIQTDPRSHEQVFKFMEGWLQLGRLVTTVKKAEVFNLTDELKRDMMSETQALIEDTVFTQNGSFSDLLTAQHTFLTNSLAQHYGMGGASGTTPTRVNINPGQRDIGILAHASFLVGHAGADHSSPVQRGKMVRTRLLCQALEPPPPGVDPNIRPSAQPTTTRDRYKAHSENQACFKCHNKMDPIGFGFEHYDAFGRWRNEENGIAVDATGQIIEGPQGDFSFNGVTELAQYLAESEDVKECMVRYWSYFAYGVASWEQDGCTYEAIMEEAAKGNFSIQSVWLAMTRAPHFTRRVQGP